MKLSRDQLKEALIEMSPAQIAELTQEAFEDQLKEKQRREAGRCDDPLGVIRLDRQNKSDWPGIPVLWVRVAGHMWRPWIRDDHGCDVEDPDLPWREMPRVGVMPEDWIAEQQEYEADYED